MTVSFCSFFYLADCLFHMRLGAFRVHLLKRFSCPLSLIAVDSKLIGNGLNMTPSLTNLWILVPDGFGTIWSSLG
jgi:hypothetical protein